MDSLYIVIPAYNESENIRAVIREWYPVVEKYNGDGRSRLVVIDDGSRDATYSIIKDEMQNKPLLEGLTKANSGHAPTCISGYQYALQKGADYIFQTDSDGQTRASEFDRFWKVRGRYDVVMGFRQHRGDGLSRLFVSRSLRVMIWLIFHESILDANVPYRLMRADVLKEVLYFVPSDYVLGNVLLSVAFAKKGCKMKFLRISFEARHGGVNKCTWRNILEIGFSSLKEFRVLNQRMDAGRLKAVK